MSLIERLGGQRQGRTYVGDELGDTLVDTPEHALDGRAAHVLACPHAEPGEGREFAEGELGVRSVRKLHLFPKGDRPRFRVPLELAVHDPAPLGTRADAGYGLEQGSRPDAPEGADREGDVVEKAEGQ